MNIKDYIVKALVDADAERPRSKQTAIGPSQVGGCRASVWLQLHDAERPNETSKWAATLGTAIHAHIEEALKRQDPFGDKFWIEREYEVHGLRGHVDLYIPAIKTIVDWKTTTKKSLSYFPSEKQRWQVQLYGYLMAATGHDVDYVSLVAIPRDGDESDIVVHTEPYDPLVVGAALAWLEEVQSAEVMPAPERDAASWCQHYCSFYGGACSGKQIDKAAKAAPLTDAEAAQNAAEYAELDRQVKALTERKDALKDALRGFYGVTPSGVSVAWSEVAGRQTIDEDAVMAALGYVPKKQGSPSLRLTVKGGK